MPAGRSARLDRWPAQIGNGRWQWAEVVDRTNASLTERLAGRHAGAGDKLTVTDDCSSLGAITRLLVVAWSLILHAIAPRDGAERHSERYSDACSRADGDVRTGARCNSHRPVTSFTKRTSIYFTAAQRCCHSSTSGAETSLFLAYLWSLHNDAMLRV